MTTQVSVPINDLQDAIEALEKYAALAHEDFTEGMNDDDSESEWLFGAAQALRDAITNDDSEDGDS
jgi:hypothetical protein